MGRSLSQDVKNKAKTKVKEGQGDKGDRRRHEAVTRNTLDRWRQQR